MKSGFISIVGRPNVGKSTLVNSAVGAKVAIVSDKPQTTRTRLQGIYTCQEGQVIFVDTPGIHKPKHLLGEYMVNVSTRSLREVDIIYHIIDVSRGFGPGEQFIINELKDIGVPVFLIANKIDLVKEEELGQRVTPFLNEMNYTEVIYISATKKLNLDRLMEMTFGHLPDGPLYYPDQELTDQPVGFLISELIREKVLTLTRDEVPHSIAVELEEMKEQGTKLYIRAVIHTEKESQKGIIIGHNGQMLKAIGEQARLDIEEYMERPAYLALWVKVKKNWRDNENNLRQFGYRF